MLQCPDRGEPRSQLIVTTVVGNLNRKQGQLSRLLDVVQDHI